MKRRFIRLAILTALGVILAGCIASPATDTRTDTHTDSHDTTSATTQETTQEQDGNRPLCIAFLNIGSCNQNQSSVEVAAPSAEPAQTYNPNAPEGPGIFFLKVIGTVVLFLMVAAVGVGALFSFTSNS